MLVIISDLHLNDGTCGSTLPPGAFELFAQRLCETAEAASWRSDDTYRPVERVDIVLLGDVVDTLRSARWAATPAVRPWGNTDSPDFVAQAARITDDILRTNEESLGVLRGLSGPEGLAVPPAMRTGQPAADADLEPVPVSIHYMVGNHDWFYHLPSAKMTPLRQKFVDQMGLANPADRPFPHDFTESEDLLEVMRRHRVAARHGDLFDRFNFEGNRCQSSLGDAIVIDLISRFSAEVESQLADDLPASTIIGLREIDNIRPLLMVPVWIDGLLERTCSMPAMRQQVKAVWDRIVDEFLAIDFVRRHETWSPVDPVDELAAALKFSKRLPIGWAASLSAWLNKLRGSPDDSYWRHALAEQDFRNRRAKHIIYGHTHEAETVPLDASYAEGIVLNQVYFNSGTWRRVHLPTQLAPGEHEFIPSDMMTYVVFFQGDERRGRPYETWSGSLGFQPPEVTVHRIDPAQARPSSGWCPAPAPTSAVPVGAGVQVPPQPKGNGPHFLSPPARRGIVPTRRAVTK